MHKYLTLEFYRLLFTIIICLHHSQLVPFIRHGYLAVEFFFIVSGFLLCRSFYEKGLTVKNYFVGRIKKLYPQYLFALVAISCYLLFRFFYHGMGNIESIGLNFLSELFVVQGLLPCLGANNYPMWYLAVLIWGGLIVYFILKKCSSKLLPVICPSFVIGYYIYNFSVSNSIELWSGINTLLRGIADMFIGLMLYKIVARNTKTDSIKKYSVLFKIIGLIGLGICICSEQYLDIFSLLFFPILLVGVLYSNTDVFHISKISKYCYPMYLNHALVLDFSRRILLRYMDGEWVACCCVVLILFYSILTYHIVNWMQYKITG